MSGLVRAPWVQFKAAMSGVGFGLALFVAIAFTVQRELLPAGVSLLFCVPFIWIFGRAWRDSLSVDPSQIRLRGRVLGVGDEVVAVSVGEWRLHYFGQPFVARGHCLILVGADGEIIQTSLGSRQRSLVQSWITQVCRITGLPLVDAGPQVVAMVDWP